MSAREEERPPTLEDVLDEHIPRLAALLKRAGGAPPIDAEFIDDFADALSSIGCTPDEFLAAKRVLIATEQWFPSPATIIEIITKGRSIAQDKWQRHMQANMVLGIDSAGVERLCYKGWVHDGRIIPGHKRRSLPESFRANGKGCQEMKSLPSPADSPEDRLETMEDGPLQLFASLTGLPAAVAEVARRRLALPLIGAPKPLGIA